MSLFLSSGIFQGGDARQGIWLQALNIP